MQDPNTLRKLASEEETIDYGDYDSFFTQKTEWIPKKDTSKKFMTLDECLAWFEFSGAICNV